MHDRLHSIHQSTHKVPKWKIKTDSSINSDLALRRMEHRDMVLHLMLLISTKTYASSLTNGAISVGNMWMRSLQKVNNLLISYNSKTVISEAINHSEHLKLKKILRGAVSRSWETISSNQLDWAHKILTKKAHSEVKEAQ